MPSTDHSSHSAFLFLSKNPHKPFTREHFCTYEHQQSCFIKISGNAAKA